MGAVYLAKDLRFEDSFVALKKITIEFDKLDEKQQKLFKSAFEREANLLAKLSHELIPRVTDYFSESDSQYLVMELVDGDDLGALLAKRGAHFPVKEVTNWSFQILDALDYLHNQNPPIIHRDLKPANLKLTTRGKVKLLDFGIAKGTDGKNNNATTVTNHTFVGATLNYSPIEQLFRVIDPNYRDFIIEKFADKAIAVFNQNADTRSDTFALGATFYHLTTGLLPNDALKRALDVWAGKPDPLPNPTELNPDISPELAIVLLKSLSTDVDARYSSAKEMSEALHLAVAEEKTRKSKASKNKKEKPFNLDNFPTPANLDATIPFFPQVIDLGEQTQVEPSFISSAATQVEPLHLIPSSLNEPEIQIQDTQVGQSLAPQDTQINGVTSTQEPKFDSSTFTDKPLNNDATSLPIGVENADLTGVSYFNKNLTNEKTLVKPIEKIEANPIDPNPNNAPKSKGAAAGLSKNSIVVLASTAGIGLAIIATFMFGLYWYFSGRTKPTPTTSTNTTVNSNANGYSFSNTTPVPTSTVESNSSVTNSTLTNSSSEDIKAETMDTPKNPTTTKKETPKVAETPKQAEKPTVVNTPKPVVTTTPKPAPSKPKLTDDCLYNKKC